MKRNDSDLGKNHARFYVFSRRKSRKEGRREAQALGGGAGGFFVNYLFEDVDVLRGLGDSGQR